MQKWNDKFKTARENRQLEKAKLKSLGCFIPVGTKNMNVTKTAKLSRRNSRMSAATFTNIDFEYTGNTNQVQHLIQSTNRPDKHPSQLNFELNLRTYRYDSSFKGPEPWQYPQANEYYDSVAVDKPTFGHAHQLNKTSGLLTELKKQGIAKPRQDLGTYLSTDPLHPKYSSKYRIKNVGELKLLLKKGAANQPTLSWVSGLRPNLGNSSAWSLKEVLRTTTASNANSKGRLCYCPPKF